MITLDYLKKMKPGSVIATGVVKDERLYSEPVRWVAKRGAIHDWAIYYHLEGTDQAFIEKHGNKCISESVIKSLVPCDDDAFKWYRY